MPTLPTVQLRQQAPQARYPEVQPSAGAYLGKGLSELGAALEKLDEGANRAEAIKSLAIGKAGLSADLQELSDTVTDPEEFRQQAEERKQARYNEVSSSISNDRARKLFTDNFQDELILHGAKINHLSRGKKVEKAKADTDEGLAQLLESAKIVESPENLEAITRMAKRMVNNATDSGMIDRPAAVNMLQEFQKSVREERAKMFDSVVNAKLDKLANEAIRNPAIAGASAKQAEAIIDQAAIGLELPAHKVGELKAKASEKVYVSSLVGRIDKDPFAVEKDLNAGLYDDKLSNEKMKEVRRSTNSAIESIQRQLKAAQTEREKEIGRKLEDYENTVMRGQVWAGDVRELAAEVKGTKHERKFLIVTRDSEVLAGFGRKQPAEQLRLLNAYQSQPMTGDTALLIDMLKKEHRQTIDGLNSDPMRLAIENKVIPPVTVIDAPMIGDPSTLLGALRDRSAKASLLGQYYGLKDLPPLLASEVQSLKNALDSMGVQQKAATLRMFKDGLDDSAVRGLARQLDKADASMLAMSTDLTRLAPATAEKVLKGTELLKTSKDSIITPTAEKDAKARIDSKIAPAYMLNPKFYEATKDAIMAYYASDAWESKPSKEAAKTSILDKAIDEVTGGILTIRGRPIIPPFRGASESEFLEMTKRADFSRLEPAIKPQDIINRSDARFLSYREGTYQVMIGDRIVMDKNGYRFILDLSQLDEPASRLNRRPDPAVTNDPAAFRAFRERR
jgi:hypothetical protein